MSVTITNQKVLDFFKRNKTIDPNLFFANVVDFYEYVITTMKNGNTNQLLTYIIDNSHKIDTIKNEVSTTFTNVKELVCKLNSDTSSNIISKLFELRNSYVEDVKGVMFKHDSAHFDRIKELSQFHQDNIINTTYKIINDMGIKLTDKQSHDISANLVNFQRQISDDVKTIFSNNGNIQDQLHTFASNVQQKMQTLELTLHQQLVSLISASEERYNQNNQQLSTISEQAKHIENIQHQLNTLLNKFNNSSQKGRISENLLGSVLTRAFPSAEIIDNASDPHSCDFRIKRKDKFDILIENKTYTRNVDKDEVAKFLDDIEKNNCCGILLSQESGICNKDNWQIDIHNGNVVVYVHNVSYDSDTIQLAVQIIDHLYQKLVDNSIQEGTFGISQDTLLSLNSEFQVFIKQRDNIINFIRNFQRDATNKLKELQLPQFQAFLSGHFSSPDVPKMFSCKFCEFSGESKHAVSGHLRSCKNNPKNNERKSAVKVESVVSTSIQEPTQIEPNNELTIEAKHHETTETQETVSNTTNSPPRTNPRTGIRLNGKRH